MPQFVAPRPQAGRPLRKPRNPLVGPALMRLAGRHGTGKGGKRQTAQRELQKQIKDLGQPERCP